MAKQKASEPIDTHGHTVEDTPEDTANITLREAEENGDVEDNDTDLYLAQTPEEVQAQIANVPGEDDPDAEDTDEDEDDDGA